MRSLWSITYGGPHHGVVLKKLARVGKFTPLEVERERFLIDDKKIEHASFLLHHDVEDRPSLLMAVLDAARLIFPEWRLSLLGEKKLTGEFGDFFRGYESGYTLPTTSLRSVKWEINEAQNYSRQHWLSGQPDRW